PQPDGSMLPRDIALQDVLRRALGRAGIVTGYRHVCRTSGCTHREIAQSDDERLCPTHRVKLWPVAQVRPIRFHDLRHTTASLLIEAGCSPASVQRILGHADVKLTMKRYAHTSKDFLRKEMGLLSFGLGPESEVIRVLQATSEAGNTLVTREGENDGKDGGPMGDGDRPDRTETKGNEEDVNGWGVEGEDPKVLGVQVVAGSNPVTPTNIRRPLFLSGFRETRAFDFLLLLAAPDYPRLTSARFWQH
ncbi:MAG: tyrosine-type recombinase/integrase, partial [Thaumarchaeota archaeon]|nr:tyrosine-type recombinase/integrase [Nitrososphaerota archaeon]